MSWSVEGQNRPLPIKAVAFDAFAIFDPRPVFSLVERLFPERGVELGQQWRTRQFEYTWLRNSMRQYVDFWRVTQDALTYAAERINVHISSDQKEELMSAYLRLRPWPDVVPVLDSLRKQDLRLALLSNFTPAMLQSCVHTSHLDAVFALQLSTDRANAFKPDPAAYALGVEGFQLQPKEIAFVAFAGWDAAGAKTFGYPAYWVNRLGDPPEELGVRADAIQKDLTNLPAFTGAARQNSTIIGSGLEVDV